MNNDKKSRFIEYLYEIVVFYIPAGFIASVIGASVLSFCIDMLSSELVSCLIAAISACLATFGYYVILKKRVRRSTVILNAAILILIASVFSLIMWAFYGDILNTAVLNTLWIAFPYFPLIIFAFIFSSSSVGLSVYPIIFASMITALAVSYMYCRRNISGLENSFKKKTIISVCAVLTSLLALNAMLYLNRPAAKYSGHGFDYMNGYSSTDFTGYMVYSENSKLVTLDHNASLRIDNPDEMPVMDGAEACYPVYAAAAKAVYKDIDVIEKQALDNKAYSRTNGKIVTFTNTVRGFIRLAYLKGTTDKDRVDLFFGARPSKEQIEDAKENGVELEITPIGKEAFVFFVVKDNPVEDLSSEQLRGIYHGDIKNWSEIGSLKQPIKAFQRPRNSGSQTMMEYFMGDVSLKEPDTYETIGGMGDVIKEVAQYNSEPGAMGYTFRYFLEELNQEDGVKMLSVDGVYPSVENIRNGSYPLTVDLCLITRKDDPNPNVQKMIDFMLSEDGRYIVEQTGYAPIK